MNVPIGDKDSLDVVALLCVPGRDGYVIEQAETHAAIGGGVMAGRPHYAEGICELSGEDGIYGLEDAASGDACSGGGVLAKIGVSGAQLAAMPGCLAVNQFDVVTSVGQGEFVISGAAAFDAM